MLQLGNLAVVCANRPDVQYTSLNGVVTVCVGRGPERTHMQAKWDDDDAISNIIRELNFGKHRRENMKISNEGDFLAFCNYGELLGKDVVSILVQFPELDATPEIITFFVETKTEATNVVKAFQDAVGIERDGNNDRFTALDNAVEAVERKFSCTSRRLTITSVEDVF